MHALNYDIILTENENLIIISYNFIVKSVQSMFQDVLTHLSPSRFSGQIMSYLRSFKWAKNKISTFFLSDHCRQVNYIVFQILYQKLPLSINYDASYFTKIIFFENFYVESYK